MRIRARLLAVGLFALLGAGILVPASAWASEPEVPFWSAGGARVESGTRAVKIMNASGVKVALRSHIETIEVEIRCESGALGEDAIEGSQPKHAGKVSGALDLEKCKLFAKEGESFNEVSECTVAPIKSGKLNGALWLEGKKGEGATAVVVFESKESPLAKIAISGCALEGDYSLTGSFAAKIIPLNEEFEYTQWLLPETAITTAWRPPGEEGETKIGLALEGNPATLQGEMKVELESHERFDGGTAPVAGIEAPFWGLEHKRLQLGEEEELKEAEVPRPPSSELNKLSWKLKGTEVETRCGKVTVGGPKIEGSLNQHDGRFQAKSIKLSECTFFAKEKGEFIEQKMCEVPAFSFLKLSGKLWLLGFRTERNDKPILVLGPESLTGGKAVLGTIAVKNRGSEKCPFLEENYVIEGGLLTHLTPENAETKVLELSITESAAHVWQSAEQEAEKNVVLSHGSERVFVDIPSIPLQPKSGRLFGAGSTGVGEGLFESTNGKPSSTSKGKAVVLEGGGGTVECGSAEDTGTILSGIGGTQTLDGPVLQLKVSKWNECKAKSAEFKEIVPKVKACTLDLIAAGNDKARGSVVTECTAEATVLSLTCTIHLPVEKSSEKVNFGLEKNALENSGSGLLIKAENSGLTTTTSGTCLGVKGTKEGKFRAKVENEGVNWE